MDTGDEALLTFWVRQSRRKARGVATAEAQSLLEGLDARSRAGGPWPDCGSVFWIGLPLRHLPAALLRLPRLGYSDAVDLLLPHDEVRRNRPDRPAPSAAGEVIRWRGGHYRPSRVYELDPEVERNQAPDRRRFLFQLRSGEVRAITGYRGSSDSLARRGLPACDAKLVVNLVFRPPRGILLDPFAGAGGIVIAARGSDWTPMSCDRDPALRFGLQEISGRHIVGDATNLPLPSGAVDATATEPPYDLQAAGIVLKAFDEMSRVLRGGRRLAILCARGQAPALRARGTELGLRSRLDAAIDRKGMDVVVLAWEKPSRPD